MNRPFSSLVLLLVLGLAVAGTGCAISPNVTTTRLRLPNGVVVDSGKDVKFDELTAEVGASNFTVIVKGYSSAANVEAIKAQGAADADKMRAISDAIKTGAKIAAQTAAKSVAP